jgi:hypothetical protein
MNEIELHNRSVMLKRVKTYWLQGVLQESLHGGELIDLSLAYRPSALAGSVEPAWQQSGEYDIPLPYGTKISTVFAAADNQLLILGEPGAGKTTMLLQLVDDLLAYAEKDETAPIPVVFSLASWHGNQPLDVWLVNELSNNYEVPRQLGRAWIDQQQFIPLLDGLDEVERDQRTACADAINAFRAAYPGVWMLVTTRSQDYKELATRVQLDKAIMLQPLAIEQIDRYLANRGPRLIGLRTALYKDATLRELAQTPLLLSVMTLAYYRMPVDIAISLGDPAIGRKLLFDVYVERMSRYRGGDKVYDPRDTVHWLAWLAERMEQQNRTIFFLENMQPGWLPSSARKQFARSSKLLVGGVFLGSGLLAGLLGIPAYDWIAPLIGVLLGGLAGLIPALTGHLWLRKTITWDHIDTVESLDWSWSWAWLSLAVGGMSGILLGLLLSLWRARAGGAFGVPWWLLLPVFLSVALLLEQAIGRSEVKIRTTPGLGLQRSRRNGLVVGLGAAGLTAVLSILALGLGALFGVPVPWPAALPWVSGAVLFFGLTGALRYGGLAYLQFRRLSAILEQDGSVPAGYVDFLDYAAERNLLRKVGGGFTFMHALLLDYFRKLRAGQTADPLA